MGLFSKIFKSPEKEDKKQDFSYIAEIAALITSDNAEVMEKINYCISNPEEYEVQWATNGIDYGSKDFGWINLISELEEGGYLFSVDFKCELEDFLWALEQIKTYSLIDIDLSSLDLDENGDVTSWGRKINAALNGKALICTVDVDSDSYELIIVSADVYNIISDAAESNGHKIDEL